MQSSVLLYLRKLLNKVDSSSSSLSTAVANVNNKCVGMGGY